MEEIAGVLGVSKRTVEAEWTMIRAGFAASWRERTDRARKSARSCAKEVFLRAVRLPASQRPSYLDEACGDDLSLRQEVQGLLSHHQSQTVFPGGPLLRPAFRLANALREDGAGLQAPPRFNRAGPGPHGVKRRRFPVNRSCATGRTSRRRCYNSLAAFAYPESKAKPMNSETIRELLPSSRLNRSLFG